MNHNIWKHIAPTCGIILGLAALSLAVMAALGRPRAELIGLGTVWVKVVLATVLTTGVFAAIRGWAA